MHAHLPRSIDTLYIDWEFIGGVAREGGGGGGGGGAIAPGRLPKGGAKMPRCLV